MPELPEVETTRRGVAPHVIGRRVVAVAVHDRRLRWPVSPSLRRELPGRRIVAVTRRAKYLLFDCGDRHLVIHLGMSGYLRIQPAGAALQAHDHLDILLDNGKRLLLNDPRRFGCALWLRTPPAEHALLKNLGPEPFADEFTGEYLFTRSRGRSAPVKNFLMDGRIVVGVGNIYASEALFVAGIHPKRAAGRVRRRDYATLADAVRRVLNEAIRAGGTTLRDFADVNGDSGYFQLELRVYDRAGQPCLNCGRPVRHAVIGQRSSYWCPRCQR